MYYNYADHVMDNFRLRAFKPSAMPMSSNVDRRTLGTRISSTWQWDALELIAGVDAQKNEHRKRMSRGFNSSYKHMAWNKDADFHQYGVFGELNWTVADAERLISGVRLDRVESQDFRNKADTEKRSTTLPSGFVRYERDMQAIPATTYIGLGHSQRFPDYWELFSGGAQAFADINPEKTTQVDLGIQYSAGPVEAWASAYVGQVRDYIMFDYGMMSAKASSNIDARVMGVSLVRVINSRPILKVI